MLKILSIHINIIFELYSSNVFLYISLISKKNNFVVLIFLLRLVFFETGEFTLCQLVIVPYQLDAYAYLWFYPCNLISNHMSYFKSFILTGNPT